jgi:hypothetical protein
VILPSELVRAVFWLIYGGPMCGLYKVAAAIELGLVLVEIATGTETLPIGGDHAVQIAVLFGAAFVADELRGELTRLAEGLRKRILSLKAIPIRSSRKEQERHKDDQGQETDKKEPPINK